MKEVPPWPRWPWPLTVFALMVPLADLILVALLRWDYLGTPQRISLALFTTILLTEVQRRGSPHLATPLHPTLGWLYWFRITVVFGTSLLLLIAVGAAVVYLTGNRLPVPSITLLQIPEAFNRMCVEAPLIEEVIYRQAICGALISYLSPRLTIAIAGVVFAILHWVYGNPSPENQVGGFILAWMYLRSGTLAVPILFHALGNLGALFLLILAAQFR